MAQRPPTALRVLFVEDSPDDAELIARELNRHGFSCWSKCVKSRGEFLAALNSSDWDVILSDHSMHGFSSTEALYLLRHHGADIPFIIVSGNIGEDAAVEAMRGGAHDYVLKHNLRRLGPAVERELREAANRRMQKSTEAALQASEQRLRQAQKMESVGRLAAGIAHDFNNLLTVILGFTEFLIERLPEDADLRRDATEIRAAAQRATDLTRQLLAFSRQQVLERRVVDLIEAVSGLQPMIARLIGEDVQVELDLSASPQWVLIDPGQFEQVLMNLAVNARDAMPSGGRLRIAVTRAVLDPLRASELETQPGAYVLLTVQDSGEGIAPDAIEHIFEPFFTTKPPGTGTGLGLSTVFGIVTQSGGVIDVESRPNRGTTFRIYFPLSAEVGANPAPPQASAVTGARASTILLAEDEPGVRIFLDMALRRAGHTVITTQTGPDAVAAGQDPSQPIDLLITDVVMPGMSGPDVAEQLGRIHPEMRVLFLSGYSCHAALPARVTAEPAAFLEKPFTIETLMTKVRERLAAP